MSQRAMLALHSSRESPRLLASQPRAELFGATQATLHLPDALRPRSTNDGKQNADARPIGE
eukprot:scaffold34966_cov30-Tisochrysis_lutea.AAC.7